MEFTFNLLDEIARELPIIRPIKEFIHLNLLLPYQHLPFWNALMEASSKLEANPFPGLSYYQEKIKSKELPIDLLTEKLKKLNLLDINEVLEFIQQGKLDFVHHDSRMGILHDCWNELLGINIIELADGMLIKWLSMFLDQGIGDWQMPRSSEQNFYQCVRELLYSSRVKPIPFKRKNLNELLLADPARTIQLHLDYLCPDIKLQKIYIQESIMTLRGWAGLIYTLQQAPDLLPFKRKISLVDFLALKLTLERAWVEQEKPDRAIPKFPSLGASIQKAPYTEKQFLILRACQEALEEATYEQYLKAILFRQQKSKSLADFQVVFCMDDRESSLRQFIEDISSRVETFGTAGHFGVECLYQHPEDAFPKKQCPAPVSAKVFLQDVPVNKIHKKKNKNLAFEHIQPSGNILHDWLLTHLNALSLVVKLSLNLFFPLTLKHLQNVIEVESETQLKLLKESNVDCDVKALDGLARGYTLEQMADLVYNQLLLMGMIHHFAPLVFILGHGSHSENNPYFATYGCGACSGRPGIANARAFVGMANNPEVRKLIKEKFELNIPLETYFIAGMHDTCRDIVELYEINKIPNALTAQYQQFRKYLSLSLYKNARERSKVFKLVSYRPISKQAHKEVLKRSYSLFETRPEMGHTNVAYALVGKRETTRGLIPNRPTFFQSYDPQVDPRGELLAIILGAVIPVCSGINLDYFFSRVDNLRFGAGSKLPQNIVGNFGVSHGTESDLLCGLPFQMIDQHRPLRLLVMVEQKPHVALAAIQDNPQVKQIVYNSWVHYACYDKETNSIYFFDNGQMILKKWNNNI